MKINGFSLTSLFYPLDSLVFSPLIHLDIVEVIIFCFSIGRLSRRLVFWGSLHVDFPSVLLWLVLLLVPSGVFMMLSKSWLACKCPSLILLSFSFNCNCNLLVKSGVTLLVYILNWYNKISYIQLFNNVLLDLSNNSLYAFEVHLLHRSNCSSYKKCVEMVLWLVAKTPSLT